MFSKRPKAIVCYICGQQYGSASIGIHIPQCQEKWEKVESQKPLKERRSCPKAPIEFEQLLKAEGPIDFDKLNDASFQAYNTDALVPCACGRTFLPDSLIKHQKGCKVAQENPNFSSQKSVMHGGSRDISSPIKAPGALRPKALMCYICGREYGTASLEIHLKSCQQKWEQAQELLPPKERRPCPTKPVEFDGAIKLGGSQVMEEYNNQAFNSFNTKALVPCTGCGRTFLPDSLIKHQKGCKAFQNGGDATNSQRPYNDSTNSASPDKKPTGPVSIICHICGRQFGSASLDIHKKQCRKKWEDAQLQLPQNQRRPVPLTPQNGSTRGTQEYNDNAFETYNKQALVVCNGCSRTFLPESLIKHQKGCQGSESRTLDEGDLRKSKIISEKITLRAQSLDINGTPKQAAGELLPCGTCGRSFNSASLAKHQPTCKLTDQSLKNVGSQLLFNSSDPYTLERQSQPSQLSTSIKINKVQSQYGSPENVPAKTLTLTKDSSAGSLTLQKGELCQMCGKTFKANLMPMHQKSCNKRFQQN